MRSRCTEWAASSACCASGIFADGRYGAAWNLTDTATTKGKGVTGILYGSGKLFGSGSFGKLGFGQLASQAIGCLVIIFVMGGIVFLFFKIQNAMMKGGIRPTAEVEEAGMDLPEMGVLAYDNLVLNELDIVGPDEGMVLSGGASPDPTYRPVTTCTNTDSTRTAGEQFVHRLLRGRVRSCHALTRRPRCSSARCHTSTRR